MEDTVYELKTRQRPEPYQEHWCVDYYQHVLYEDYIQSQLDYLKRPDITF